MVSERLDVIHMILNAGLMVQFVMLLLFLFLVASMAISSVSKTSACPMYSCSRSGRSDIISGSWSMGNVSLVRIPCCSDEYEIISSLI